MPPKSDSADLRADIDDGYARVANLLLEAASCAPLSGGEFRIIMFVARRTYGWAKHEDRETGKLDTMTAAQIMTGTGLPKGTVGNCLSSLCKANVLLTELALPDTNRRRYGINPDVNSWGEATADWSMYRVTLKDARERGSYNREDLLPNTGIPLPENRQRSSRNQAEVGAQTPRGAGDEGVPTTSLYNELDNEQDEGIAPPSATLPLDGAESVPEPAPRTRRKSAKDLACEACLGVWGIAYTDLLDEVEKGKRKSQRDRYFSGMGDLVKELAGGAADLQAWADKEGEATRVLGEGADPAVAIPIAVKAEVKAVVNQGAFAKAREAGGGNNGACLLFSDGTKTWERDWAKEPWEGDSYEFRTIVARETAAENWVRAKGVTKRPVVGLCCADGYFYRGTAAEPTRAEKVF